MLLLLVFIFTVLSISSYQTYQAEQYKVKEKIKEELRLFSSEIKSSIKNNLDSIEKNISSVKENELFINYLKNHNKISKNNVEQLFINLLKINQSVFQFRFINKDGLEKIRVERAKINNDIKVLENSKLQDKSKRYYFREIQKNNGKKFWYSNLDLNIEDSKLDYPIIPTYRIGTRIESDNRFLGILIVNIDMSQTLNKIVLNNEFDATIFDKDGYTIIDSKTKENWSRYLTSNYNIYNSYPELKKSNFIDEKIGYLFSLETYFKNDEKLKLLLSLKENYINQEKEKNFDLIIKLLLILFIPSIIVAVGISLMILNLLKKFTATKKENKKYFSTIDQYVITLTADKNHIITSVSTALCEASGYSKSELIGKHTSFLRSGDMKTEHYKNIKNTIHSGCVWVGEIKNKTKNGETYWLQSTIVPNFDEKNNEIISFTSLSENITNKKIIEKLSQTDKLTQLYNRFKLDKSLNEEMNRFQRYQHSFSILLIDIDYFKAINDTYGHNIGDTVLIEISHLLKKNSRKTDIVGRWGGEEFLIICPDTPLDGAISLAQLLRKKVEEFEFSVVNHKTVSIGVAYARENDNLQNLLKRADDYLYEAKESGRNKVISQINSNK